MIKSVNILGRKYTVEYVDELKNDDGAILFGQINYQTSIIEILKAERTQDAQFDTLSHEVMHGVLNQTGIEYMFTPEEIEVICQCGALLAQTMKGIK